MAEYLEYKKYILELISRHNLNVDISSNLIIYNNSFIAKYSSKENPYFIICSTCDVNTSYDELINYKEDLTDISVCILEISKIIDRFSIDIIFDSVKDILKRSFDK